MTSIKFANDKYTREYKNILFNKNVNTMKKLSILAFIVIFITGSMTKATAQDATATKKILHSGQVLKVKNTNALPTMTEQQRVMNKAASTSSGPYWSVAQSYFNSQYSNFSFTDLSEIDYYTEVTIDGDKATFSNIVDNSLFASNGWTGCNPVTGVYDAEKQTITIKTPEITDERPREDYTELGEMTYYGSQVYVVLLAGDFSTVPDKNGNYGLYMEDELVFDVSDDGTTLTPRTGYGAFAMYVDNTFTSQAGYMTFYKTSSICKMTNEPNLAASPETFDLTNETIFTDSKFTRSFKLKNMGLANAKYTIQTSTDEIEVLSTNEITAGTVQTLYMTLTVKNEGPFEGTVTFTDQNGKSTTMTVKANIKTAYDYSSVIKNGDIKITHYDESTSAAEITSDITGYPVIVTTNTGDGTLSGVNVNINVPEGQVATFSWKGWGYGQYPNKALITMDDQLINDDWVIGDYETEHNLSDKIILTSGTYDIMFGYYTKMDWYTSGTTDTPLRAYYYDFDLRLYSENENNVDVYSNEVKFDTAYYDKQAKTDTIKVKLYNISKTPLTITGVETDGPFSAVKDDVEIAPYTTGYANITFTREGVGDYEGNIVLKTNNGDVNIHCTAATEKIIYDYSVIVDKGDFSFDTSMEYPWLLDGNKAYSPTAYMKVNSNVIDSWIEASFIVPEGNTGTLTWNGRNSSIPWWDFMGEKIFEDGTIIYADGVEITRFADTVSAGSDQLEEPLTFSAGQHNIRFLYRKIASQPEGEDRYMLYNLALNLTPTSNIGSIDGEKAIKSVEYYTISGERLAAPTKGINIIKNTYEDGTSCVKKVVLK